MLQKERKRRFRGLLLEDWRGGVESQKPSRKENSKKRAKKEKKQGRGQGGGT